MVLNAHINHKAYQGRGEGWEGGMEVGEEGDYMPIATFAASVLKGKSKVRGDF